jgi:uncharacterized protein
MKFKNVLGILFAFLVLAVVAFIFSNFFSGNISFLKKQPVIIINNNKFNLLIAKTQKDQQLGLSKYSSLPQNEAMIFPFSKDDYYGFWMKDMKFPIDIIFIKKDTIVTIYENLKPPKLSTDALLIYQPTQTVDTVVEINAGLVKKQKITVGDKISYENFSN